MIKRQFNSIHNQYAFVGSDGGEAGDGGEDCVGMMLGGHVDLPLWIHGGGLVVGRRKR